MQLMGRKLLHRTIAFLGVVAAATASYAQSTDVLKTAKEVGAELKDWKYGDDASKKTIDADQFMLRVVQKLAPTIKDDVKKRILMSDLTDEQTREDKDGIVTKGDKRTKGVTQALLDAGLAHEVALKDARPGDILLYWIESKSSSDEPQAKTEPKEKENSKDKQDDKGKKPATKPASEKGGEKSAKPAEKASEHREWHHNAGVIERVEPNAKGEPKAWLYSSHRLTHGIGTAPKNGLRLVTDDDRRIYVVRFGKKPLKP